MSRALAEQPSLKLAQLRIQRAQAAAALVEANAGLQVNGAADLTRQRFSSTGIYPPPLGGSIRTLASAQLGLAWEFDYFGRNRAALDAAIGQLRAARADRQAARNLLAASVAQQWIQLARWGELRSVAVRTWAARQEILDLIKRRVQAGLDTRVELRQAEGALPEAQQQIELIDEQLSLTRHALAALAAQPPGSLDGVEVALGQVALARPPTSLSADLLGRRADIVAARWRIEAAGSDVGQAKAQFFPNINLSAFAGLSSIGLDRLLRAGSEQYGVGPAIRLPIFDAGRLRANLGVKTADLDAAVESYNAAVIDAVHEVADAVASLRAIDRQQQEQALAQDAAESAWDLADQRFKAGLSSYLVVLSAESQVLVQRRLAAELKTRAMATQIALVRALGGGYAPEPETRIAGEAP